MPPKTLGFTPCLALGFAPKDSSKGFIMKDWIFPSVAFLIFLYGLFFLGIYVDDYKNSKAIVFTDETSTPTSQKEVDKYLKEISKSFKGGEKAKD